MGDEIDFSNRDFNFLNSYLGVSVLEFMIFFIILFWEMLKNIFNKINWEMNMRKRFCVIEFFLIFYV